MAFEQYKVSNCYQLNVRKNPSANNSSAILKVLNKEDIILAQPSSVQGWLEYCPLNTNPPQQQGYIISKYAVLVAQPTSSTPASPFGVLLSDGNIVTPTPASALNYYLTSNNNPSILSLVPDVYEYIKIPTSGTPDKDHGIEQASPSTNGPQLQKWDGYLHTYVLVSWWNTKFNPDGTPKSSINPSSTTTPSSNTNPTAPSVNPNTVATVTTPTGSQTYAITYPKSKFEQNLPNLENQARIQVEQKLKNIVGGKASGNIEKFLQQRSQTTNLSPNQLLNSIQGNALRAANILSPTGVASLSSLSSLSDAQNLPSALKDLSPLVDNNISNTVKSITPPQAFGDQIQAQATQQVISAVGSNPLVQLRLEKINITLAKQKLEVDHILNIQKIEAKHVSKRQLRQTETGERIEVTIPPELTDEEYEKAIDVENKNYEEEKKNLEKRAEENQKAIDEYIKDKKLKQKKKKEKRKRKRKERKRIHIRIRTKALRQKLKTVYKNNKKEIASVLISLGTVYLIKFVKENNKLKDQVDITNHLIDISNNSSDRYRPQTYSQTFGGIDLGSITVIPIERAKLSRDKCLSQLNKIEKDLNNAQNFINKLSIYLDIFNFIATIIVNTPIPTSVPPGIGIPVNVIMRLVKILDKANRILLALSAYIPIALRILSELIDYVNDLKRQLKDIEEQLEGSVASGSLSLINTTGADSGPNYGTLSSTYKGFKFAIREDNSFGGVQVGQYKRHYAVAIDTNNVDVLKSEYSFTLDPNDLIEQLKLVIDQQNLQA